MKIIPKKIKVENKVEGPIEAGQSLGMDIHEILECYLETRNNVISILRMYYKKSVSDMALALDISETELEQIENSSELVPFQLVPKIADFFDVDLKMLLIFLGHASSPSEKEASDNNDFSMAAQYSGPDLAKQEKVDLNELFRAIVEHAKNK